MVHLMCTRQQEWQRFYLQGAYSLEAGPAKSQRTYHRTLSVCCDMYYDYHGGAVMGDVARPQKVPQPEMSAWCHRSALL